MSKDTGSASTRFLVEDRTNPGDEHDRKPVCVESFMIEHRAILRTVRPKVALIEHEHEHEYEHEFSRTLPETCRLLSGIAAKIRAMAKKSRESTGGLDRVFELVDEAPAGLHDLETPAHDLPPGLPEPLIELYARCDGGRFFHDTIVVA